MSNKYNTTLYTGMTNNLKRRVKEHKTKHFKGFTSKYNITKLVYFDTAEDDLSATKEEKRIKGLLRKKKIALIEEKNPNWEDLSVGLDKNTQC